MIEFVFGHKEEAKQPQMSHAPRAQAEGQDLPPVKIISQVDANNYKMWFVTP